MSSFCIGRSDTQTSCEQHLQVGDSHAQNRESDDETMDLAHPVPFPSRPSSVTADSASPAYQVPRDLSRKQIGVFDLIFSIDPEALNPFGHIFYERDRNQNFKWQRRTTRSALPAVHVRTSLTLADITFRVRLNETITIYVHVPRDSWENATCDSRAVRAAIQKGYFSILQGDPRSIIVRAGMIPATLPEIRLSVLEAPRANERSDHRPSLELNAYARLPAPPVTQGPPDAYHMPTLNHHTQNGEHHDSSQFRSLERWVQTGGLSSIKPTAQKAMEYLTTLPNDRIGLLPPNCSHSPLPSTVSPPPPLNMYVYSARNERTNARLFLLQCFHQLLETIHAFISRHLAMLYFFFQNIVTTNPKFIVSMLPFGAFLIGVLYSNIISLGVERLSIAVL
ncbi:hypothetical protein FRC14_003125 [Serendipita sp. 396]|nr:hypothetical protein FRC14_003125 [Serendipita sp. 396]KAG8874793.1 hypothetical protein FRC20_005221 [Serendipita sp. 405]